MAVAPLRAAPSLVLGAGVEVDAAPTRSSLHRDFDGAAADDLSAACDRDPMRGALPVAPAEPGELAAAHAGVGGETRCTVEPEVRCVRTELGLM